MKLGFLLSASILLAGIVLPAFAAKPKLPPRYEKWLNQEVVYIITDEERKAFLQLNTAEERDRFIEEFWEIRNPQPGSARNPYKEEIYQRIEYANEHFGRMSNTPGWMTDMGRTYILLGKPVSTHPFVGYGQIYPLELWSYMNQTGDPSLPAFFNLLFFQPEDIEEYRFYRPYLDGPMKLVRGSNFNSNADVYRFLMPLGGDVAHAAFSVIPNDPIDRQTFRPDMSSDMVINKIENLSNDSFNVRKVREMRALRGHVRSYFLVAQDRPLKIDSFVVPDPSGQYWLDYVVAVDEPDLGVPAANGTDLNLRIEYHLMGPDGGLIAEDSEQRAYPAFESGSNGKAFVPFEVANRLPIVPGSYRLEVDVINQEAGKTYKGVRAIAFTAAKELSLRGPLLAGDAVKVERPDGFTPFEYYGVEFHPSARGMFLGRKPLTILYELEQPPANAASLNVEYVIAHVSDRSARRTLTDTLAPADFRDGHLLKAKTIPLAGLGPGDYRLIVNLRRTDGGPVVQSANLPLKIVEDGREPALYFSANSRNMARRGVAPYIRGLEAAAQKDEPGAAAYMRQALDQNPADYFAGEYLVQMYFRQRNYEAIADLYDKLGIALFKHSPEAMAQISLGLLQTKGKSEARKALATARTYFPEDRTLRSASQVLDKAQ